MTDAALRSWDNDGMTPHGKLIFVDLETTGARPDTDRITEIGIVTVEAGQVTRWSTLVNPGIPIPPFIENLTGIRNAMVRDAPAFDALIEDLRPRLEGGLFIAHNARFDYGFLRSAFQRAGHDWRSEVLCTVKLSRTLFPAEAKHNLDALIARHQLLAEARHRALADADLLWQLWNKLVAAIAPPIFDQALQQVLQRPILPPHLAPDNLDAVPDTAGVYLFFGEHDLPLYVGRSTHVRQRVLAHFDPGRRQFKDLLLSQQTYRVEWRETVGEVGAQLLEAQLLKRLRPLHNRAQARAERWCAWQLRSAESGHMQPLLVYANEQDFGRAERLYGLFGSRSKAQAALRELAENHQLCPQMLGLEPPAPTQQACSAHQRQRCRGACIGREPALLHQARLEAALASLKLQAWPYPAPVGLVETAADGRQEVHVVHNWCCLGSAHSEEHLWGLLEQAPAHPAFDPATYKILTRALARAHVTLRMLA